MLSNLLQKRNLLLLSVVVLSLFLMVGCSSSDSEMSNVGQSGVLKVNVPGVKDDSGSNSLQTLVQENSDQIEVEIKNQANSQDKYNNSKTISNDGTEFSFGELEVGAKYQIVVKVKDKQGNVLYQTEKTSTAITENSITEVTVDLSKQEMDTGDINTLATATNQAVIYYKRGFETPYIHYAVDGTWTDAPGVAMEDSQYAGYSVITIDLGDTSQLEAVFNDGNGNWDNNGGSNYTFSAGTSTFKDGNITSGAPQSNQVTVYYKEGFSNPYIHYRPVGGTWTTSPGEAMEDSQYSGYSVITIDIGEATQLEACFNDGNGTWDSNGGDNYIFDQGTWTFDGGNITSGAPESDDQSGNEVTVYYKEGFSNPYIHYRPVGGTWTNAPGEAMEDSQYSGYSVKTIDIGTATQLEACFNDGNGTWDSNGGDNYIFDQGTWTFDAGNITSGAPTDDGDNTIPDPSEAELPNIPQEQVNQTMYQAFYWNMDGGLWTDLQSQADDFAQIGITSMWLPPATKAWGGVGGTADESVGYDVHDFWDLGEFNQNGSVGTKYGTKSELENAISALHSEGIKAYADTVFNHRMGGDNAETVDGKEVWTDYTLDGRDKYYNSSKYPNLYHDFNWDHYVFDSADGELFSGKSWDVEEDYLMGSDVDYEHTWVTDEMKAWGEWMTQDINFDGFRLDAVKHVKNSFVNNWINHVQYNTSEDVFVVGEAWIENVGDLESYLDSVGNSDLRVFDFPLRNRFVELSSGNKDLSAWGAWDGLVHNRPSQAVTFVDNHDTCREGNPYGKPQVVNFKNQAYAYILMRENGVPAVYARDYTEFNMAPALDKLVKARRYYAYGPGHEVGNNSHDVYSYVREGLADVPGDGLVMMISDGTSGNIATKNINSYQPNTTFYDITGNVSGTITTDSNGYADFKVTKSEGKGWSVWVPVVNE